VKQVCVIGNSHSACFKLAWDSLNVRYPDIALTFFAHRGQRIGALAPRNGKLVPTSERLKTVMQHTSGGHSAIDFRDFDVVLIVGTACAYPLTQGHFSFAVARQTLLDVIPNSVAFDLIKKIRQISDIPVFVAHQPLLRHMGEPSDEIDLGPYRKLVKFLNDEFMQDMGAVVLKQPAQTITDYFFTRPEFAVGSKRLDIGIDSPDADLLADSRTHMNVRYGDVYLSTHLLAIAYAAADGGVNLSSSGT
jgi:hypothetical protein